MPRRPPQQHDRRCCCCSEAGSLSGVQGILPAGAVLLTADQKEFEAAGQEPDGNGAQNSDRWHRQPSDAVGFAASWLDWQQDAGNLRLGEVRLKLTESITINKNSVYGDASAVSPGGVRLGTAALTSRSFAESDMHQVALFLHEAFKTAVEVQRNSSSKQLKDFMVAAASHPGIKEIKENVGKFSRQFPFPGIEKPGQN
jgi:hypothetical protein